MDWELVAATGLVLAFIAFFTWVYIRRDLQELAQVPALKKFKRWQLIVGYLVVWLLASWIIERLF